MVLDRVLSTILDVKAPWFIQKMDVHKGTKTLNVFINFERGSTFKCPNCEQDCKVHDSTYRVWRHLDVMDYRCYLNIKLPRIKCSRHKVLAIDKIPWGRTIIHFTQLVHVNR